MAAEGLADYHPEPGRFDELIDHGFGVRPGWRVLVSDLATLGPKELARRQTRGERLLEAEGASHLLHDDSNATWRFDPVPMVLEAAEWAQLESGVRQRAELLDAVLADLAGPRRLVHEGIIPIEAIAGSAAAQVACEGIVPSGGFLASHAVDLIRDASGRWLVLRDHTDPPTGLASALFHRAVASQLLPDSHRHLAVQPVAPFLTAVRNSLVALAPEGRESPRTVVLTPGTSDPFFVEHSYLATRLGYHLVTGADLTVRKSQVWLRSLTGLEPVDVILRFTRDAGSDPLELRPPGAEGVAGLTHVARSGRVGLANALGSGLASELALAPFLDEACRRLLGAPLRIPGVSTRWCGLPDQLDEVLADPSSFVLFESGAAPGGVFVDSLADPEPVLDRLRRRPSRFVAQRKVRMATTPVSDGGVITPGRAVLRLHLARSATTSTVMPGGQAHVVDTSTPIFTQRGDAAKDVWVVGGTTRIQVTTVAPDVELPQVDFRSSLTSRAAEALFWLGRNAERAETVARYVRVLLGRSDIMAADPAASAWLHAVLAGLRSISGEPADLAPLPDDLGPTETWTELAAALGSRPGGAADSLSYLVSGAGGVREYLSQTTWRVIAALQRDRLAAVDAVASRDQLSIVEGLDRIVLGLAAFAGLSNESVVRGWSWRFLDLGRRLERSLLLLGLMESTLLTELPPEAAAPVYEVVLAACESLVVYRRQYRSDLRLEPMLQLLVGDETNPRSLGFQLERIGTHLFALPGGSAERVRGLVGAARSGAHADRPLDLVLEVRGALLPLVDAIRDAWFTPVEPPQRLRAGRP